MSTYNGWEKEKVDTSIVEKGFTHIFKASEISYLAIAIPAELGALKHIYQNGLYSFDLIDTFKKSEFIKDGKKYILYKLDEETLVDNDKFEFLWKDRN